MGNSIDQVARIILSQAFPTLGSKSRELVEEVFNRYNLEGLTRAKVAYLAAAIGTLAEKLERAEDGTLEMDERIAKVVESVLRRRESG